MKSYVLGFAFRRDETGGKEVLLIRKARPENQRGLWNGLGGRVDMIRESRAQAMAREFAEEANVATAPEEWLHFATLRRPDAVIACFSIDLDERAARSARAGNPDEPIEWFVLPLPPLCGAVKDVLWLVPISLDDTIVKVVDVSYITPSLPGT